MSYNVRDWVEIRREYLRQLAELEARLVASETANAVNSDEQIERLLAQRTRVGQPHRQVRRRERLPGDVHCLSQGIRQEGELEMDEGMRAETVHALTDNLSRTNTIAHAAMQWVAHNEVNHPYSNLSLEEAEREAYAMDGENLRVYLDLVYPGGAAAFIEDEAE